MLSILFYKEKKINTSNFEIIYLNVTTMLLWKNSSGSIYGTKKQNNKGKKNKKAAENSVQSKEKIVIKPSFAVMINFVQNASNNRSFNE